MTAECSAVSNLQVFWIYILLNCYDRIHVVHEVNNRTRIFYSPHTDKTNRVLYYGGHDVMLMYLTQLTLHTLLLTIIIRITELPKT